jgi:hypothetical protein
MSIAASSKCLERFSRAINWPMSRRGFQLNLRHLPAHYASINAFIRISRLVASRLDRAQEAIFHNYV